MKPSTYFAILETLGKYKGLILKVGVGVGSEKKEGHRENGLV